MVLTKVLKNTEGRITHYLKHCCYFQTWVQEGKLPRYATWLVLGSCLPLSVSVQLLSCILTATHQTSLSITISWSLLKLTSIELVMPSNHLVLCCPLLLPSIFPSIRVFSNEFFLSGGQSIGTSPSASVLPMNIQGWFPLGLTGLISLQSKELSTVLSQHHSSNASILHYSAFFMAQFSHPYMTIGKTITLTRQTFVSKVMSLLSNMLSRFVIAFLPRSKHLLISWLQVTICSDWSPRKQSLCDLHCFTIYLPWSDGTKCHDLHFLNVEF